jgi:hypothetical protein
MPQVAAGEQKTYSCQMESKAKIYLRSFPLEQDGRKDRRPTIDENGERGQIYKRQVNFESDDPLAS